MQTSITNTLYISFSGKGRTSFLPKTKPHTLNNNNNNTQVLKLVIIILLSDLTK